MEKLKVGDLVMTIKEPMNKRLARAGIKTGIPGEVKTVGCPYPGRACPHDEREDCYGINFPCYSNIVCTPRSCVIKLQPPGDLCELALEKLCEDMLDV